MVCLSFVESQHVHRSAMDYLLAVLAILAIVVAARLLICAVPRCLNNGHGAAHHSPATTGVDQDVKMRDGTGLAIYRHAQQGQQERRSEAVEPPRNKERQSKLVVDAGQDQVCHIAHPSPLRIG